MTGVIAQRLTANQGDSPPLAIRSDFDPRLEFGCWVETEQKRVYRLCLRLLGDRDEADMATQDAFFKAYQALARHHSLEIDDPAKWLTRIAVNNCLDRLRSRALRFWRRRTSPEDESAVLARATGGSPGADDLVFARQIDHRLREALAALSIRQRAVFILRHYEDRSLDQIAEILQLDLGTVKAHMSRALAKLRVELRDLYQLPGEESK